jgi:palmitoyl-[glycerolipid] 3-(E)-desaturase
LSTLRSINNVRHQYYSSKTVLRSTTISSANSEKEITNPSIENNLKPRKGSNPEFMIDGDSTQVTPFQTAFVAGHFALFFMNIVYALGAITWTTSTLFTFAITIFMSVILGDLGTGIFHWAVDNYGSITTPIFGSVCVAFQGHHQSPWTITFRPFINNVYKIAIATIPFLALLVVFHGSINPFVQLFFASFINWWLLSQEIHKFSHMKQPPKVIQLLQQSGIILSRKEHGLHHNSPFEGHYCIVTGINNDWLDKSQFFRKLEAIVYHLTGNVRYINIKYKYLFSY